MSTFRESYRGIGEMLKSPEMQAAMLALAEKVKARAEEIAPFDPDSKDGDHYKTSFSASAGVQHHKTSRAYGRVSSSDPAALSIEFGTKEGVDRRGRKHGATPRHRTLGRALDALNE